MTPAIECRKLSFAYKDRAVLFGISIVGCKGRNGRHSWSQRLGENDSPEDSFGI